MTGQQITVVKRNGDKVPYSLAKIMSAIERAFKENGEEFTENLKDTVNKNLNIYDGISVEEIQEQVQTILMKSGIYNVAASYIKYREAHRELREDEARLAYMENYSSSSDNAASLSETDPNSNVSMKNIANLEGEVYKLKNRELQRRRMHKKLTSMYGKELADSYINDLKNNVIYAHDEASTPTLKPYTYSPYECVEVEYNGSRLLISIKELYNLIPIKEVCADTKDDVWIKNIYDSGINLLVKDRDKWTRIIRLTSKKRHRDLVNVKLNRRDLIVTDNHPMIVSDTVDDTIPAIECKLKNQLELGNSLTLDNVYEIDLVRLTDYTYVSDSAIATYYNNKEFAIKRRLKVDSNLGYIVGAFLGNGKYGNDGDSIILNFTDWDGCRDSNIAKNLSHKLYNAFGINLYSSPILVKSTHTEITIQSKILVDLFIKYFQLKDIPSLRNLPYNMVLFNTDFLKGILAGIIETSSPFLSKDNCYFFVESREEVSQLYRVFDHLRYDVTTSVSKAYTWKLSFTNSLMHDLKSILCIYGDTVHKMTKSTEGSIITNKECWTPIDEIEVLDSTYLSAFLNKCEYIYDITTESHSFDCNGIWAHNCGAITTYPLLCSGVGNIDGVTPNEPNDIASFSGQITNLVFLVSSQLKGAVAVGDYFISLNYYVIKQFGPNWYDKLDVETTTPHCAQRSTIRRDIRKGMKQFIYGINQPAGNRSYNSPFTNVSYYDNQYFTAMFGDYAYPDGTKPEWKAIDTLQRMFMELHRELRLIKPLTFPVSTMALVHDNKEYLDPAYKELCAEEWAKGGSFFCYNSDNPSSLASCCRVLNEMSENTFSSTTGMTGVMTGSCNVITLNINRIVQNFIREKYKEEAHAGYLLPKEVYPELAEYLTGILDRVYKYHIAYKTMLYNQEDRKMFTFSNAGYLFIKKLYSTIGVLGYCEAAGYLGLEVSNNERYKEFLRLIFGTIRDQNKAHSIRDRKRPFLFNSEAVPGESLGVRLYQQDKNDGYWVPEEQNLYNCYFYNPWDEDTSILDKLKLHGKEISQYTDGGQACHINLDTHLTKEQYLKLLDVAKEYGSNYFTFNIPMSECEDCGKVANAFLKECPSCSSNNISYWTRIIGYLTKVNNWSNERQIEQKHRVYHK